MLLYVSTYVGTVRVSRTFVTSLSSYPRSNPFLAMAAETTTTTLLIENTEIETSMAPQSAPHILHILNIMATLSFVALHSARLA